MITFIYRALPILVFIFAAEAWAEDNKPRNLNAPDELYSIVTEEDFNTGDIGGWGSELRADRVYPLNWIARMHPKSNEQTIYRISRTGGWTRDSFLIVPQANTEDFLIEWNTGSWNREKGPKGGKGLAEDIISSYYLSKPKETKKIRTLLANPLLKAPEKIGELKSGRAGDDYPFLLIEKIGPDGYQGYFIAPHLYHFELQETAESLLESLTLFFEPKPNVQQAGDDFSLPSKFDDPRLFVSPDLHNDLESRWVFAEKGKPPILEKHLVDREGTWHLIGVLVDSNNDQKLDQILLWIHGEENLGIIEKMPEFPAGSDLDSVYSREQLAKKEIPYIDLVTEGFLIPRFILQTVESPTNARKRAASAYQKISPTLRHPQVF